jgi:hypothetical protein
MTDPKTNNPPPTHPRQCEFRDDPLQRLAAERLAHQILTPLPPTAR